MAINNRQFLATVFGDSTPILASFPQDPAHAPRSAWSAVSEVDPDENTYFCVSSFTGRRRRKAEFVALHCLVVDDVGTKVEDPSGILGEPTWKLETSPHNFQWGYLFSEPITSRARAERLIDATVDAVAAGDDPGMKSVSRYVRMPEGRNWKAAHNGFPHAMWWYGRSVEVEELEGWLGLEGDAEEEATEHADALDFSDDATGLQLCEAGLMKERIREGVYDITCPWSEHHTEGEDTGTAYFSPDGFKCHHGHCEGKTFRDLQVFLGGELTPLQQLAAYREAAPALWDFSTVTPRKDVPSEGSTVEEWLKGGSVACWIKGGKMLPAPEREWILDNMISRDSVAMLGGEGGVGKGRLLVNLCIALTTGVSWGPFDVRGKAHKVIYIGKEDNRAEQWRRFEHTLEAWSDQGLDPDLNIMAENLLIPERLPSLVLGREFGEALSGVNMDADIVIIDPLMKFMDPTISLNSQEGAGWVHNGLDLIQTAFPGSCVLVSHHVNKAGRADGHMHVSQLTGSAGITDLARLAMQMLELDPVRKTGLGISPMRRVIEGAITKSNYGPTTQVNWTFEMIEHGTLVPLEVTPSCAGGLEVVKILGDVGTELTTPELNSHLIALGMTTRQMRAAKGEAVDKCGVLLEHKGRKRPVYMLDDLGGLW